MELVSMDSYGKLISISSRRTNFIDETKHIISTCNFSETGKDNLWLWGPSPQFYNYS